jgi:hypothetical protein
LDTEGMVRRSSIDTGPQRAIAGYLRRLDALDRVASAATSWGTTN